jgi:uncharacterized protein YcnI
MRCSAWSSLAISVCSALLLAAPAAAHVVAEPSFVTGGSVSTLTFQAPNEREPPMTGLRVTVPQGFSIVQARPVGPWRGRVAGATAIWQGGLLPAKGIASFSLDVKAPARAGSVELDAVQTYPDRQVVRWPVALTVVPGAKPSQNLGAALVAGMLGLLALTALVVFLRQRRLRSVQDG